MRPHPSATAGKRCPAKGFEVMESVSARAAKFSREELRRRKSLVPVEHVPLPPLSDAARKKLQKKQPLLSSDSKRSPSAWDGVRARSIHFVRGGSPGLGKKS